MFLVNKREMTEVANLCLEGNIKSYYKLFVWHEEAHNFRKVLMACLEEIKPLLGFLLQNQNTNVYCLKALLLILHPTEQNKRKTRISQSITYINPIPEEIKKIEAMLRPGIEEGHAPSCYLQALLYLTQEKQGENECLHQLLNLLQVHQKNFAPAAYLLALYNKSPSVSKGLLESAAKQGYVPAMRELAQNYYSNLYDWEVKDKATRQSYMFYWYEKAAKQGDPSSITSLTWCYTYGKGTKKNLVEAAYWIQQGCCIQGNEENITIWYDAEPHAFEEMLRYHKFSEVYLPYINGSENTDTIDSFDYLSYFEIIQQFSFITQVIFIKYDKIYKNAPGVAVAHMEELKAFLTFNQKIKQPIHQSMQKTGVRHLFSTNLSQNSNPLFISSWALEGKNNPSLSQVPGDVDESILDPFPEKKKA